MATAALLHGLMPLAEGETLVRNESLGLSIARFFMKTKMALTSERLAVESPDTSYWLMSKGARAFTYPLAEVTDIGVSTKRSTFRLVAGLALVVAGLWNFSVLWFLAVAGALLLLTAFKAVLSVANDESMHHNLEVSLLDRGTARSFVSQVKAAIEARPPVARSAWFNGTLGL